MITLSSLKDVTSSRAKRKRVGRGPGSKLGKTCGRGQKGQGARSGYKRRYGQEGGQCPLYRRLPTRGFSNARFRKEVLGVNLEEIDRMFNDGDTVSLETLKAHGFCGNTDAALKILGNGELTKKVSIEADMFSKGAVAKLEKAGIAYTQTSSKKSD